MSGYILTGGSRKKVESLRTIAGGAARTADKAYALIGGMARLWYQRSTTLGNLAVGSTVKIAVGGTDYTWLVVHQGLPGSMYDASCNGTWLLLEDLYTVMQFGSVNLFINASILNYLNTTFYEAVDERIRSLIKVATIPYIAENNTYIVSSGDLRAWVFLLSMAEVGFVGGSGTRMPIEGAKLSYFNGHSREAYFNGESTAWWSRTPFALYEGNVWGINEHGDSKFFTRSGYAGVRPCMILQQDVLVDDTGHIIGADDHRTPL